MAENRPRLSFARGTAGSLSSEEDVKCLGSEEEILSASCMRERCVNWQTPRV